MSQTRKLKRQQVREGRPDVRLVVFCAKCGVDGSVSIEAPVIDLNGIDEAKFNELGWRLSIVAHEGVPTQITVCPSCASAGEPSFGEPKKFRVFCVECGNQIDAPMNEKRGIATQEFAQKHGWFISCITPPGQGRAVLAPVCPACAPKVYDPKLLAEAKKHLRPDS